MKPIRFTSHAEEKFAILFTHGCQVTREHVVKTLQQLEKVHEGYKWDGSHRARSARITCLM
jgi:hypothetical protein